jgi:hypothetical protein
MLAAGAIAMAAADGFKILRLNLQDPIPGKDDGGGAEVPDALNTHSHAHARVAGQLG